MNKTEQRIIRFYKEGWTIEHLAEHFGYTPRGIELILKRYTSACEKPAKDDMPAIALATLEELSWKDSQEGKKAAKKIDKLKPLA